MICVPTRNRCAGKGSRSPVLRTGMYEMKLKSLCTWVHIAVHTAYTRRPFCIPTGRLFRYIIAVLNSIAKTVGYNIRGTIYQL